MKKTILTLAVILFVSTLNYQTIAQVKSDSASVKVRVDKSLQKLNAELQLTAEQVKELKQLYFQKEQLRLQMKSTEPNSDLYTKLQSENQDINLQIKSVLTSEQTEKLDKKRKDKIAARGEKTVKTK